METIQLKKILLSTDMMTAAQTSSFVNETIVENVTISPTLSSGIEIAQIAVGENTTKIYAPASQSSSSAVKCTSFEVYATSADIPAGTIDADTGLEYKVAVPSCMIEAIGMYTDCVKESCDITVDWGDGTKFIVKDMDVITTASMPFKSKDNGAFSKNFLLYPEGTTGGTKQTAGTTIFYASDEVKRTLNDAKDTIMDVEFLAHQDIYKTTQGAQAGILIPSGTTFHFVKQASTRGNEAVNYHCYWTDESSVEHDVELRFNPEYVISEDKFEGVLQATSDTLTTGWNKVQVAHNYKTPGKYIVKAYGNCIVGIRSYLAYGFTVSDPYRYNIISRVFGYDLEWSDNILNASSLCRGGLKLQKVAVPYNLKSRINNAGLMFQDCKNLIEFTKYEQTPFLDSVKMVSLECMFQNCINLVTISGLDIPNHVAITLGNVDNGYSQMFSGCSSLCSDVKTLLPWNGFCGKWENLSCMFKDCASITYGSDTATAEAYLSTILWGDTSKVWNSGDCFTGCSEALSAIIPQSWGGAK